jgi:hypothetical protein
MTDMTTIRKGTPGDTPPTMDGTQHGDMLGHALQLAQEAYTSSTTYFDASIRKQIEAGIRQFQGVHPVGSKYHSDAYRTRSRLFRPKTRGAIRKNEADGAEAFFATRDAIAVEPEDDSNEMQRASSKLMKFLVEYRLKHSIPWFQVCMGAYQDAQVTGVCVSYQYWEYRAKNGKQIDRPCIELIPLENFRFHQGASWMDPVGTSPFLIRMIPMYVKDVQARMRGHGGKQVWKVVSDAQLLAATSAYNDTTRQTRERGRTDSKEANTAVTPYATVWVHENIVDIDGQDYVYYTLSTHALLTDPVPLQEVYWHGERPFTIGCIAIEAHKTYPGGVTHMTADTQQEINHTTNLRLDNWAYSLNRRYFVSRKGQVDLRSLTRNVPGSATLLNDVEKDVKVLDTQDVTSSAFQEQDRLNLDFDDVAGTFSTSTVQSNRKLGETVGGLNLISTTANKVGNYQLRTFVETWAQPALTQVMRLEAFYEDNQRILALAKGAVEREGLSIEAVTDELMQQELMLTVDVGIGATNPQERINNFINAMRMLKEILIDGVLERYGLDVEDVVIEIFSHLGYRDGRRFFDKADDPTLAGLRAQLQELQSALEAKVNPDLLAAQIRSLDAKTADTLASQVEKGVRAAFAAMQAAEVIAAVPAVAPIADKVVQAAAGGFKPNVDPNFPAPAQPDPNVLVDKVMDPRTGTGFMPGLAEGDTTPTTPATPATGATQGIETMRQD